MIEEPGSPAAAGNGPDAMARLLRGRVEAGPQLWLPVGGGSMGPTIRPPGNVLLAPGRRPRRGEVWAFVGVDGAIVVHRCERRAGPGYVFRGDGMVVADPWVPSARLIGRVVAVADALGQRRLGAADRRLATGRTLLRRLRRVVRRARKWVVGTMATTRRGR
jgi:hypothetical protein